MRRRRKNKYKVSKAEKEILLLLEDHGYEVKPQFIIPGVPYIYDFYFAKTNTILEYQGDYWHCNPHQYKSGNLIRMAGLGNILVDYIWAKDRLKKEMAERQGFKLITLWEADYKQMGWQAIEQLL
jgi:hypothetical protein